MIYTPESGAPGVRQFTHRSAGMVPASALNTCSNTMSTEGHQDFPTYAEQADAQREAFMAQLDGSSRQLMGEVFTR